MRPLGWQVQSRTALTLLLARVVLYLTLIVVAFLVVRQTALVIAPVGTGLFLAYLLNPWVQRLERRGVPRSAAIFLLVVVFSLAMVALAFLVPPLLYDDLQRFLNRLGDYEQRLDAFVGPVLRDRLHLSHTATLEDAIRRAIGEFSDTLERASGDLASAAASALRTATGVLRLVLTVFLVPVFAIYFLGDFQQLREGARTLIPPRHRTQVLVLIAEINSALASWLRGQLTVMFVLGTLYATGLYLTGIPLGFALGVLTGLMAFVPYVGVAAGLLLALASALLTANPAHAAAGVVATFACVQALDGLLITPRVLGEHVGLSPVGVILALLLGGQLLGYAGLLLAVPMAAVLKVLGGHALDYYKETEFYLSGTTRELTGPDLEPIPTDPAALSLAPDPTGHPGASSTNDLAEPPRRADGG